MREMKNSGVEWIGEIPKEWNLIKFKYVHNGSNVGVAIDKKFWTNNDADKIFYTAQILPIRTNYTNFPSCKYTKGHDLLLARNATPYVYLPVEGAIYTDHIIRVTISNRFNRRFIRYCLQNSIITEVLEGVSIPTWSVYIWDRQILPLPPLAEQTAIASYLDKKCSNIDAIITKNEQIIEKLKEYKSSLISETVTKALSPDVKMKYIATINPACKIPNISQDDNVTFVPMECVRNNKRLPKAAPLKKNNSSYSIFNDGDIALAKVTPCFQNGNLCIMENLLNGFAFGSSELFNIRPIRINTKFLLYFLMTKDFISGGIASMTGVAGLQRVSINYLRNVRLPYPPLTEQTAIAAYLDKKCSIIDANIARRELINAKLAEYKKSLIYEVVTGKKEV